MSQPVKLSNQLVLDARLSSVSANRSIAGQIEFWASIGRALEVVLRGSEVARLKQVAAKPLAEILREVGTPAGDERVAKYLDTLPFPHYRAAPDAPGLILRVSENGTRTVGRFVNRQFVSAKAEKSAKRSKHK